jgi:hypothetical protein
MATSNNKTIHNLPAVKNGWRVDEKGDCHKEDYLGTALEAVVSSGSRQGLVSSRLVLSRRRLISLSASALA